MQQAARNQMTRTARRRQQPETRYVVVDRVTFACGIVMTLMALILMWNVGSMCQNAKVEGMRSGTAAAQQQAYDRGYEVGYANARWDLEHPDGLA